MIKQRCERCKHEWESRKDSPLSCPKCKRYDWNVKRKHTQEMKGG